MTPVSGIVLLFLVLRVFVIVSVVLVHVIVLRMGAGRAHVGGAAVLAVGRVLPAASGAVLLLAVVRAASVHIRAHGTAAALE